MFSPLTAGSVIVAIVVCVGLLACCIIVVTIIIVVIAIVAYNRKSRSVPFQQFQSETSNQYVTPMPSDQPPTYCNPGKLQNCSELNSTNIPSMVYRSLFLFFNMSYSTDLFLQNSQHHSWFSLVSNIVVVATDCFLFVTDQSSSSL